MEELIKLIVSQLGVNEGQAKGGAGLLFKLAKDKLGGGDFSKIADAVGGVEDLISAAPDSGGGLGGVAGALGGLLGGKAEALGGLASLAGGFKSLDLDMGDVSKFGSVIMDFLKSKGGDDIVGLLEKVLKG